LIDDQGRKKGGMPFFRAKTVASNASKREIELM